MIKKFFKRGGDENPPPSPVNSGKTHKPEVGRESDGRGRRGKPQKVDEPVTPWTADQFAVPEKDGETRFHDLGLKDTLMHGIADLGFQYCSPIQAVSLPYTLQGHDTIGKAQTGTGKTAAFLITIINDLLSNPIAEERFLGEARALIIAPTRELVMQIAEDAKDLNKHTGLSVVTLIGGMDYQKQLNRLHGGLVDIVVATPGRLIDFQGRGDVHLDHIEILVLDEADRMLDMGFIPQVKRIVRATPPKENRQTLLYSATFSSDIISLAQQWTCSPHVVEIEPEHVAADAVDQKVFMCTSEERFRVISNLLRGDDAGTVIVFANRRDQVRKLHERLRRAGFNAGILSGEIPQNKRTKTLELFRDRKIQVLVATDVAGRGIHVDGVSHVVNFNLPEDPEDYVHRIGRTGRAGAKGISISFASEDDAFLLPDIEKLLGQKLSCEHPPEELLKHH
ncbi:MAG: ATP-dependent RNA helicase RhlB [Halieaceae bacterium]